MLEQTAVPSSSIRSAVSLTKSVGIVPVAAVREIALAVFANFVVQSVPWELPVMTTTFASSATMFSDDDDRRTPKVGRRLVISLEPVKACVVATRAEQRAMSFMVVLFVSAAKM